MPYPDDPGEVLVSLQDRSRGVDAASGHLVLGVLVDAGRAVFQLPGDFAIGGEAQLEVLIAPTGVTGGETVVERIKPQRVWVSSLAPAERPQAAAALLAQPSRYAGEPTPVDLDTLAAVLSRNTDIWPGLLQLGVVTRTLTRRERRRCPAADRPDRGGPAPGSSVDGARQGRHHHQQLHLQRGLSTVEAAG